MCIEYISNHRILDINKEDKTVTFRVKNYKKAGKITHLTLTTKEFVRRFQLHILPKGFTRIRHYGILSSSWKKEKLPQLQILLADKEAETLEVFVPTEKSLLNCCPSCKKPGIITLITFDSRGPPKNYKELAMAKIKKYKS